MRALSLSLVVLGLALLSNAASSLLTYVVHEKRNSVPFGWSHLRRHASSEILPMRFGLTQQNVDDIESYLLDVSHPESPNYGKHWSVEKVAATFAASDATITQVTDWLVQSGIESSRVKVSAGKNWIEVLATVEEAEHLLQTEYHVYVHTSGKKHIACEKYHLPAHMKHHIDIVTPTVHFDSRVPRRSVEQRSESASARRNLRVNATTPLTINEVLSNDTVQSLVSQLEYCDKYMTPDCLRALYGLYYTPLAADKNSYGIVEYTPYGYQQSDLDKFFETFDATMVGKAPNMVSIDGGYDTGEYSGEPDLDLEYGMILVTEKQNVTMYQVGDDVEGASFNTFLDALDGTYCTYEGGDDPTEDPLYPDPYPGGYNGTLNCGTAQPTYVISTSYGYTEKELTYSYAARQCSEYAKLGLMGITILYSSGDSGVGTFCDVEGEKTFQPSFPSTCPYVTAVGATMVPKGNTVYEPEVSAQVPNLEYWSGGGFSNYFSMPSYQESAVDYYLKTYPPDVPAFMWNSSGSRGYPDISANGAWYVVVLDGEYTPIFGTSCSSPVSGAIFTMINDARLAVGKGPIGFINPTIYSSLFAGAFNDITSGSNPGCNTNGFNATKGWDAVTGLGTPNFPKLLALWLLL